jgi:uridine kinase
MDLSPLRSNTLLARLDPESLARVGEHLETARFAPDDTVVREGERARDLFLVLDGEARVVRQGLDVGSVRAGAHFGELGLVTGRARAASVIARTSLVVARLTAERFEALCEESPRAGVQLLRGLVDTLGSELTAMTDNLGVLLRERSLPRRVEVCVDCGGTARVARTGTLVGALLPAEVDGDAVVAGLVDRRPVSLATPLVADAEVAPLTVAHWEGQRVLRASTALVLLEAASRALPGHVVRLGPSLGAAQRVVIDGDRPPPDLHDAARALVAEMRTITASDVPIREELWVLEEAIDHFTRARWHDAVALLLGSRESTVPMVTCGTVYAPRMAPLAPRTGMVEGFSLTVEDGALILRHASDGPMEPASGVDARESTPGVSVSARDAMAREHERWLGSLGMDSVGAFNRACVTGRVPSIIRVAEGFHEKRIGRLADEIAGALPGTRLVCVAGPSSSGKTTFLKRLSVQLQVMGINPVGLSLDDYYVDRVRTPRDEEGEYDFEALEALDLRLLASDLGRILRGETVRTARYDFREGVSVREGGPEVGLGPRDVLLLEGIHGLNPRLIAGTGAESAVSRVFIMPMTSLPFDRLWRVNPSDMRLLRRIVRDRHGRNHDAAATILRWPSVRAGERKHIFPYFERADAVFDTSLIYEVSVLKVYAERYLLEVPPASPAFTTAFRLRQLIDRFVAIHAEHVPPTSIVREFIGESSFVY